MGEDAEGAPSEAMFNTSSGSDLQMDVDNPQKHVTPFETYITYCITTKVNSIDANGFFFTSLHVKVAYSSDIHGYCIL